MGFMVNLCAAIPGDFDRDGCVYLSDLAVLASAWLTDAGGDLTGDDATDMDDFAVFAAHWLSGCPHGGVGTPPVAVNVSAMGYTHEPVAVTLSATDDGYPNPPARLMYVITSYPANAQLQDPTPGAGLFYSRHLPWTLSSRNNVVWFWSEQAGVHTFNYRANDGGTAPVGGLSNAATAQVTLTAWPNDCLSFDGRGYVTFADHDYYDAKSGWAVHLWLRTRSPMGGIISKRGDSGAGWQIDLVGGKPVFRLWDSDGTQQAAITGYRIDDGQWRSIAAAVWEDEGQLYAALLIQDDSTELPVPISGTFTNSEPVILGRTARGGYRGEIDKLRFFATINLSSPYGGFFDSDGRNGTEESPFNWFPRSVVRFMFSEGSGTTVTDNKASALTGTLSSLDHVRWQPWNVPFVEVLN